MNKEQRDLKLVQISSNLNKKNKTELDWIQIGQFYYNEYKKSGKTQKQFSTDTGIQLSTLEKNLRKYKDKILEYIEQQNSKPKKLSRTQQLVNDFRNGIKSYGKDAGAANNNKSMKWFTKKVDELKFKKVKMPEAGKLYMYAYDAKNKDTLPVWDKFPLILCLGQKIAKNGNLLFYGLNLHYVPPRVRQEFLEIMLVYQSTKRLTSKTVLKVDWQKVKQFHYAQKMIKAYLPGQMKSPASEVPPQEWSSVIWLPTQQFVSGNKRSGSKAVWK